MSNWFSNLTIHRLHKCTLTAEQLKASLAKRSFKPCRSTELVSMGWVPPIDGGDLVRVVDGQMLIALCVEKRLLPGKVVNAATKERAAEIETQQGYKPGRKQLREIKEQIIDELLPKAFCTREVTRVWIDPAHQWLVVDAASATKVDMVRGELFRSIDGLQVVNLQVNVAPVAAMTNWLTADEAPASFTIDENAELRGSGERKASVRIANQALEGSELQPHLAAGKRCVKLAMTWNDRISFALHEDLSVRRVKPLDVLKESKDADIDQAERLDADFTLMAGELSSLCEDLVTAMGGERTEAAHG